MIFVAYITFLKFACATRDNAHGLAAKVIGSYLIMINAISGWSRERFITSEVKD